MRFAPGVAVLRSYDRAWLRPDVLAGITVAAYLVPQCMAYAEIAGLPAVVGLWAILLPLLAYSILGSSRQLSVGPESTTAVMTAAAVAPIVASDGSDYAALCAALAIIVGLICIIGFFLRLGFLARLLSRPILVGYLSGVGLTMISGQLGKVSGLDIDGDGFFEEVASFFDQIDMIHGPTAVLAIGLLVFLFAVQHFFPKAPGPLFAVILSVIIVSALGLEDEGVSVVGEIPSGLPSFQLPGLGWGDVTALIGPAFGIALVGYSDNVMTARAFAVKSGQKIDADQELLALGTSNVATGFFQGFPISSSGSRTTLGDSIGSKTQVFSLVALAVVVAVLFFLGPLLEKFPNAALGAIVIYAAIKLIDVAEFRRLLRFRRSEFLLALATTMGVLVTDILTGVLIAIALSVVDLFTRIADPHDAVLARVPGVAGFHDVDDWADTTTVPGVHMFRYDAPLFFANAENFLEKAIGQLDEERDRRPDEIHWFILQAEAIGRIDSTAGEMLEGFLDELERRDISFVLAEAKQDLDDQLRRIGLMDRIGVNHVFPTIEEAVAAYGPEGGASR